MAYGLVAREILYRGLGHSRYLTFAHISVDSGYRSVQSSLARTPSIGTEVQKEIYLLPLGRPGASDCDGKLTLVYSQGRTCWLFRTKQLYMKFLKRQFQLNPNTVLF